MKRFSHYLKKNESTESPNNILFVDTEAMIEHFPDGHESQSFRLGYAIHIMRKNDSWSETEYELHSIEDFWKLLDRFRYEKKRLYVIAHNMAYDYAILKIDSYLSSRKLKQVMAVIDSVFIVKTKGLMFISSTNFYRESLKSLGDTFGFPKMQEPNFDSCSDPELMAYCAQDVRVLAEVMKAHIAFIRDNDLGCFAPTIAGQAFATYRHRFMNHKLLAHDHTNILELERDSYRGGRCEAFRLGTFNDIVCLDINSMYPFIMKTMKFPTKVTTNIMVNVSVKNLKEAIDMGYFVLAECLVNLRKPLIACREEKLIFPIGQIRRVLTSPEIEYILNNIDAGEILEVRNMVEYEQYCIFSEYVDFFYTFRTNTNNPAYKKMAKVMLNSLYGKFGQRNNTKTKLITDNEEIELFVSMMNDASTNAIHTNSGTKYVRKGNDIYRLDCVAGEYARDSMPIIASAVTSYARILLFELMETAGFENVYYCDTDSLFVNQEGFKRLKHLLNETELGMLKIEKRGTVTIRGAKDYTFNGITKRKGIKKNAKQLDTNTFMQLQFQTKQKRYSNGTPDGIVIVEPIFKTLTATYDKGHVIGDKIIPFTFGEP